MGVKIKEAAVEPETKDGSTVVVDSKGRRISIREPTILQESRLVRMMGEAGTNAAYMTGYVLPAAMVTAIDGEAVFFPLNQMQVEAMIERLGREGMGIIMQHIVDGAKDQGAADAVKK